MRQGKLFSGVMWLAIAVAAWCVCAPGALAGDMEAAREQAAHRQRRVLFNNDSGDATVHCPERSIEAFLGCRTTGLVGTHCDAIFYCTSRGSFGSFSHDTDIGETFVSTEGRYAPNITQWLMDQGTDPLEVMVDFGHEHGLEMFWSMRMNDTHDSWGYDWEELITSQLKKDHPEWLTGSKKNKPKVGGFKAADYTHPEIRDFAFRYIEEICQEYDVEGVELDFFRHPVFFKRHAWGEDCTRQERDRMTDMVRRVRAMADREGKKRGRPILVSVRVPDSVQWCNAIGLDIERWLEEGLVDMMSVTGYFRLNPWKASVELGHKHGVPVYACLSETRIRDKAAKQVRSGIEAYRARALTAWHAGADGIYLFNAFNPGHPLWRELGDPELLRQKDKVYTTGARGTRVVKRWLVGGERFLNRDPVSPERPHPLKANTPETVELIVPERIDEPGQATLGIRLEGGEEPQALAVRLNGTALTLQDAGTWWKYETPAEALKEGANEVTVELLEGDSATWADLALWVKK